MERDGWWWWWGGGFKDGCRPRLGRAQCQGLSGTPSFLGARSAPSRSPGRVQGYMVSARQVHLPHYLCPAHASALPSPAPPAPYGNDLLLPDLSTTRAPPSAYVTTASVSSLLSFMKLTRAFICSVRLLVGQCGVIPQMLLQGIRNQNGEKAWKQTAPLSDFNVATALTERRETSSHISSVSLFCSSSVKMAESGVMVNTYIEWSVSVVWRGSQWMSVSLCW